MTADNRDTKSASSKGGSNSNDTTDDLVDGVDQLSLAEELSSAAKLQQEADKDRDELLANTDRLERELLEKDAECARLQRQQKEEDDRSQREREEAASQQAQTERRVSAARQRAAEERRWRKNKLRQYT